MKWSLKKKFEWNKEFSFLACEQAYVWGTHVQAAKFNLVPTVPLSHSWEEDRETLGTTEIRDQGRLTSFLHKTPNSHFAAHTWDSKVNLLSGSLFPEHENQCRDLWERLEASWSSWIEEGVITQAAGLPTFICWNENTILLCKSSINWSPLEE